VEAESSEAEIPWVTEGRTEGHFCVEGLKVTMNHAEGYQYAGDPRPRGREAMDMCHVTIRGYRNFCKL
jgi:hypothetical protein